MQSLRLYETWRNDYDRFNSCRWIGCGQPCCFWNSYGTRTIMKFLMIAFFALSVSACGNTISGVGKDISDVGAKVTEWQNAKGDHKDAK